ncbi:hypothetical protein SDC9_199074 [bioreactor metagenome]|uniref:Uncharacterized protein n=1 Tax=bioreactor metagenome TaxID=1076179 RepID=A0A645ILT8_9ZZZZ
MVGAGHPKRLKSLHTLIANQNILQGVVERVTHMKLPGDVGRRNDNGKRLFVRIGFGVKIVALNPTIINSILNLFRIVGLFQFFSHVRWTPPFLA